MADWRYFWPSFWDQDDYIVNLKRDEKFIFVYLFTNPYCNQAGVYKLPLHIASLHLDIPKEEIQTTLQKFQNDKKIEIIDGFIWIKSFLKRQPNRNPSVWKRIIKDIEKVSLESENIKTRYLEHIKTLPFSIPDFVERVLTGCQQDANRMMTPCQQDGNTLSTGSSRKEKVRVRKKEKVIKTSRPKNYRFSDEQMEMVEKFIGLIKENKPNYRFFGGNFKERWANEIRLMVEIDKRPLERVGEVMEFALSHPFWKKNILSVEKLRKQFDRLELEMDDKKKEDDDDLPILRGE